MSSTAWFLGRGPGLVMALLGSCSWLTAYVLVGHLTNLALDRETQAVGRLQREMLPGQPPDLPGYEWSLHYETSTRAGGDYYDFVALPEGRVGILIADASGHGAAAAVLMAVTRALFHQAASEALPPDRLLANLSRRNGLAQ